jgi:lipoprotein-anchoring transpeptidase ErfK/SrfK
MAIRQLITPRFISVNKSAYNVSFWKFSLALGKYKRIRSYRVAIGAKGHETPLGMYFVQAKTRKPEWLVPKSDWAPQEMWGKIIPYGDINNPFDGPFIAFDQKNGYGLHGTKNVDSIGSAASHGCIRMKPDDAKDLYKRAPVGTPVFIYA